MREATATGGCRASRGSQSVGGSHGRVVRLGLVSRSVLCACRELVPEFRAMKRLRKIVTTIQGELRETIDNHLLSTPLLQHRHEMRPRHN